MSGQLRPANIPSTHEMMVKRVSALVNARNAEKTRNHSHTAYNDKAAHHLTRPQETTIAPHVHRNVELSHVSPGSHCKGIAVVVKGMGMGPRCVDTHRVAVCELDVGQTSSISTVYPPPVLNTGTHSRGDRGDTCTCIGSKPEVNYVDRVDREAACMCHHITRTRIQSNNFETHHVVGEHAVMECKPWDRNVSHGTGAKVVSGGDSREYW